MSATSGPGLGMGYFAVMLCFYVCVESGIAEIGFAAGTGEIATLFVFASPSGFFLLFVIFAVSVVVL